MNSFFEELESNKTMEDDEDIPVFKIVIVGDADVGKTSLLLRYITQAYQEGVRSTIGVDVKKKIVEVQGHKVGLAFYDTAGQEKFQSVSDSYFNGSTACIVVYDITRLTTFKNIEKWVAMIKNKLYDVPILFVGNKSDIEQQRDVRLEDGENMAKRFNAFFMETSCLNGNGVNKAINILVEHAVSDKLVQTLKESQRNSVTLEKPNVVQDKTTCC
ncbi:hypothetical protein EIN_080860 [Entamoeba invadens IP1]|uniref:hypothetical protein n=1 Tax=Entamoeba invadens IP1 TaxID=370355 RepID=UPI0002C3D823|nr:hypothetical protein EIN_080860 [Entamoeba invadens IP1]ELP85114.1 hypothetical protein EIN_080860 [Entamoeba invadens IP1]|eukprot:XP_004184460.1 hypothetical protein EIN_080860 [Entamoeba invadens IP1]